MNLEGTRFTTTPCTMCRVPTVECTLTGAKNVVMVDVRPAVGGEYKLSDTGGARPLATRLNARDQALHAWGSLHKNHLDTCEKRRR